MSVIFVNDYFKLLYQTGDDPWLYTDPELNKITDPSFIKTSMMKRMQRQGHSRC